MCTSTSCQTKPRGSAGILHLELVTRMTDQRLYCRSRQEDLAAGSVRILSDVTRKLLMEESEDGKFTRAARRLLEGILQPHLVRWQDWADNGATPSGGEGEQAIRFRDEWSRRRFRAELRELQPRLLGASETFEELSRGGSPDPVLLNFTKGSQTYYLLNGEIEKLWKKTGFPNMPLESVIRPQVALYGVEKEGRDAKNPISDKMHESERKSILRRRAAMQGSDVMPQAGSGNSELYDAFGLALSGGGIRSATFCLGVVQSLHKRGLFRKVDYLSTVSGGGYLGTFLTSYLGHQLVDEKGDSIPNVDPTKVIDDVLGPSYGSPGAGKKVGPTTAAETPPLRHLRNNSKYLLNGGNKALLKIGAVFLNGVFAAFLMLLSLPVLVALGLRFVELFSSPAIGRWTADLLPDRMLGFFDHLSDGFATTFTPAIFQQPGGFHLAVMLGLCIFFLLLRPFAQRLAEGKKWKSGWVQSRKFIELGGNLLILVVLVISAMCAFYLWVPQYAELVTSPFSSWAPSSLGATHIEWVAGVISAIMPTILGLLARRRNGTQRKWAKMLFLLTGPLFFLTTLTIIARHMGVGGVEAAHQGEWIIGGLGLLAWVFLALNVNTFALHRYYRERLCECYLAVPADSEVGIVQQKLDNLTYGACQDVCPSPVVVGTRKYSRLSEIGLGPAAPYHLINATLNAPASRNPELRGRNGDFFVFSREYCGSPLTGYITTEAMETEDPGIDLGTAMAISGAAASTNMGSKTMREYRFLMTLFNIRLGYWMRRPGLVRSKWRRTALALFRGPGPVYFFREMLGLIHQGHGYVNLSDGGHIENLGAYELLRRQCRFIVCVDAGMEPGMECADLMRLQRLAEIDFGINMRFDLSDLTPLPSKYSRAYGTLVKIDYAPEEAPDGCETSDKLGWMLYLKLAMTGTEPRHVLDYHRQNPEFPHQTTKDQFYDEAQFESYRSLGHCAASNLFRKEVIGSENMGKDMAVHKWFECLATSLLSDNDEVFR
ncbi:hypothetical protein JIN84_08755 [Luteolibacter yonseiensis]|uniref:PNPLA domain-containing protein n=1 Tax=Luteolibacter yonseiensis TaxID=1144680 RepID=A0A934R5U4_9BACT|nr:hypothetical protein [Luteolibacter yonseiensis]MBK1815704.1 hypothetical protein [Luteolibacter yonseiensis]